MRKPGKNPHPLVDADFGDLPEKGPAARRLSVYRILAIVGVTLALLLVYHHQRRSALAACLPRDLTLETEVYDNGGVSTIGEQLARAGVYEQGGKAYDRTGREVYFYMGYWSHKRIDYSLDYYKYHEAVISELKARYSVIALHYYGNMT